MKRGVWYPWLLCGAVMEWWALRNSHHEATLSRFTRWLFRTRYLAGRVVFMGVMAWFTDHIIRSQENKR